MKQETKFGRNTTLRQVMDELKGNGLIEITKVTENDGIFTFEYEVE